MDVIHAASGEAADIAVIGSEGGLGVAAQADAAQTPAEALEAPLRAYAARLLPKQAAAVGLAIKESALSGAIHPPSAATR